MKIRDLIRLIVLVLVVVFLGLWAFGGLESATIGTTRFLRWDNVFRKSGDIGARYAAVYTIGQPEGAEEFNQIAAADQARNVFEKRLNEMGAEGVIVRQMNENSVWVELPGASSSDEVDDFLKNRGVFLVKQGDDEIFTNKDVKSVKMVGYDSTTGQVYVDVHLVSDAKERLANLTGPSSSSMTVTMDDSVVSATYSSTEKVKNGVMRLSFTTSEYTKAMMLVVCVGAGMLDGTVTPAEGMLLEGGAGLNAANILGIAALAAALIAVIYLIAAHRLLGVSAALSLLIAVIALDFFGATFTWLQVNMYGVAGFAIALLLIMLAHIVSLSAVKAQFESGKSLSSALDDGLNGIRNQLLELLAIPAVTGIGLWICGIGFGAISSMGIALLGGAVLAAASSMLLIRHITRIFIGIGITNAATYGLKRGE